jgi:HAD superfamily hydrolase (TIGR01509 family)
MTGSPGLPVPPLAESAWLFDVDGTLVDSNYLHVAAWLKAFDAIRRPVQAWRIHRRIGMDSAKMLGELLGADAARLSDDVKAAHQDAYAATTDLLRPLPGSRELIAHLASEGAAIVLATSAPPDELAILRRVLDIDDLLKATTDADDVDTAKPDPGIVQTAVERSGRPAECALFVGDAVWDMQAAVRAGVSCVGVRTGGISDAELHSAGASATYDDAAQLLAELLAQLQASQR